MVAERRKKRKTRQTRRVAYRELIGDRDAAIRSLGGCLGAWVPALCVCLCLGGTCWTTSTLRPSHFISRLLLLPHGDALCLFSVSHSHSTHWARWSSRTMSMTVHVARPSRNGPRIGAHHIFVE
ncbi:hypothetical protein BC567DRAFT_24163 [Phyllosticta citribraziliensis]